MGAFANIKKEAKALRKESGMSHMTCLEILSRKAGYTGWNDFREKHQKEDNFNRRENNY